MLQIDESQNSYSEWKMSSLNKCIRLGMGAHVCNLNYAGGEGWMIMDRDKPKQKLEIPYEN
jgi:hypothetical protein